MRREDKHSFGQLVKLRKDDGMTQKRMVDAFKAILTLTGEKWPLKDAYALHKMKGQLQAAFDFQAEREMALITSYGGEQTENGWRFPSVKARQEFETEIAELNNMESDVQIAPLRLKAPDGMKITPDALGALDGFIEFTEG